MAAARGVFKRARIKGSFLLHLMLTTATRNCLGLLSGVTWWQSQVAVPQL